MEDNSGSRGVSDRGCLGSEEIAVFLEGGLDDAERAVADIHLAQCTRCRRHLTELARVEGAEPRSYHSVVHDIGELADAEADVRAGDTLAPGSILGRYVVLGRVGAGGMGVVYSGYDPELDRRIAIKVIRTEVFQRTEEAQSQLRREARVMAQLTHPNVVRIYDVGASGSLVYLAMEFVDGESLGDLAKRFRGDGAWLKIVDACVQAGDGLRAAHEAGLVHRDFKPSNVLVAADGRVLVADFGLTGLIDSSDGRATAVGTPGYAAPEQAAGVVSDARSDQYSFCVAALQCLHGRAPDSETRQSGTDEQENRGMPRRIRKILEKGCSPDPRDRFATMEELLSALRATAVRRQRTRWLAAGVAGVAIVGGATYFLGSRSLAEDVCADSGRAFAALWSPVRRGRLEAKAAGSPQKKQILRFADEAAKQVSDVSRVHRNACQATYVDKTQSTEMFDRQMFCLGAHTSRLKALIAAVEDGGSAEPALRALVSDGLHSDCTASDALLKMKPVPRGIEEQQKIRESEDHLVARYTLTVSDDYEAALVEAEAAVKSAASAGYQPLVARALLLQGDSLRALARYKEATTVLKKARDAAAKGRDDERLISTLLVLSDIAAEQDGNFDKASALIETARSLSLGVASTPVLRARVHAAAAVVANARKVPAETLKEAQSALDLLPAVGRSTGVKYVKTSALSMVAAAHFHAGRLEKAEQAYLELRKVKENIFGPEHGELVKTNLNLATVQYMRGDTKNSALTVARAKSLFQVEPAVRVVSDADRVRALQLDGLVQRRLGNYKEALRVLRKVVAIQERLHPADHARVWSAKNNLGNVLGDLEKWDEAVDLYRERAEWAVKKFGAAHGEARRARANLANGLNRVGRYGDALELISEILAHYPEKEPGRGNMMVFKGDALEGLGRFSDASAAYRSAAAIVRSSQGRPALIAHIQRRLAETLWRAGSPRRALQAGEAALEIYAGIEHRKSAHDEMAAWLTARRQEISKKKRDFPR